MKLTPDQRVIDVLEKNKAMLHEGMIGSDIYGVDYDHFPRVAKEIIDALTANTEPEDEHNIHDIGNELRLGDWCFVDCECRHCKQTRIEITQRKIEEYKEYMKENYNLIDISGIEDWLQEDK